MSDPASVITNVRVFDGLRLTEERAVGIADGKIVSPSASAGATTVDGQGGTLLPGLIDAHVHLRGTADLERAAPFGVTTMLDMASYPPALIAGLRALPGLPDIRSAGIPASGPGGMQTTRMGFPLSSVVTGADDAERFVAERVTEGSDYIKIIVEDPRMMGAAALDAATIAAIVHAAHARNLRVYAHVTTVPAVRLATEAGVDVLTHAPVDAPLDAALVEQIAARGSISVPTLVMMRSIAALGATPTHREGSNFQHALASVAALRQAGVPVLAGTDANVSPGSPFHITYGEALHDELGLLVTAGLSPLEALRSATILPAQRLDLGDRGMIAPGRRADLLLVAGDPTTDIQVTRAIQGVWMAGRRIR